MGTYKQGYKWVDHGSSLVWGEWRWPKNFIRELYRNNNTQRKVGLGLLGPCLEIQVAQ